MFGLFLVMIILFLAFAAHQVLGWLFIERPEEIARKKELEYDKMVQANINRYIGISK